MIAIATGLHCFCYEKAPGCRPAASSGFPLPIAAQVRLLGEDPLFDKIAQDPLLVRGVRRRRRQKWVTRKTRRDGNGGVQRLARPGHPLRIRLYVRPGPIEGYQVILDLRRVIFFPECVAKGSRLTLGGLGVELCSRPVASMFGTVGNRPQPFAVER